MRSRFQQFAWFLVAYNLAVVYWGVYVRASFSGDGCGAHWPFCGGQVFPANMPIKTVVEFTHRASSLGAMILVLVLAYGAFRSFSAGHGARLCAVLSVAFTYSEALIGAGLVLFKLVAHNPSLYRGLAVASHLTNTFLLLASLSLTAWSASGGSLPRLKGLDGTLLILAALGLVVIGITGVFAALGDTLFPSSSIIAGIKEDFAPTASYLLRLRPFHPFAAVLLSIYMGAVASILAKRRPAPTVKLLKRTMMYIFAFQLCFGFVNLMKHAPVWMQLQHLLIADILWINLILFAAAALSTEPAPVRSATLVLEHA